MRGAKMADDIIHLRFPQNYGRAWVELLEGDLSEHARICYVAMTSFGPESRAGKEAIRRRMGVKSLSTVKAAQIELAEAGWIKKTKLGGGLAPNEWDVLSKPNNGQLPLLGDQTPRRTVTGALYAPEGVTERPTPGRVVAPKQEDKHESNKETKTTPVNPAKHLDEKAFWTEAKAVWGKKFEGANLAWPTEARGFQKTLTAQIERLGWKELSKRWANCVTDPFSRPSMRAFISDTDKWITARQGATNGRAFQQPTTDWAPSGKKAPR